MNFEQSQSVELVNDTSSVIYMCIGIGHTFQRVLEPLVGWSLKVKFGELPVKFLLKSHFSIMHAVSVLTSAKVFLIPMCPLSAQCFLDIMSKTSSRKATQRQLPNIVVSFAFFTTKK